MLHPEETANKVSPATFQMEEILVLNNQTESPLQPIHISECWALPLHEEWSAGHLVTQLIVFVEI